jgi:hypothetical protein
MRAHEFIKPLLLEYKREVTISNPKTRVAIVKRFFQHKQDLELAMHWLRSDRKIHSTINEVYKPELERFNKFDDSQLSDEFREFVGKRRQEVEALIEKMQSKLRASNKNNTWWVSEDDDLVDLLRNISDELNISREYDQSGVAVDVDVLANSFMNELEQYDPTPNKKYVPWMLQQYLKNNVKRLEDMTGVNEILEKYDKVKKLRGFPQNAKNLTALNYDTLRTLVREFDPDDPSGYSQNMGDYDIIYGDIDIRTDEYGLLHATPSTDVVVIHPKDKAAGIYFGRVFGGFAEWCTAYVPPRTNMFDYYNQQGPMYVIVPKVPRYEDEKYQVHDASHQFADKNDHAVNLATLFLERFPQLRAVASSLVPKQNLQYKLAFTDDVTVLALWKILGKGVHEVFIYYMQNMIGEFRKFIALPPEERSKRRSDILEFVNKIRSLGIDEIRKLADTFQNTHGQLLGMGDMILLFSLALNNYSRAYLNQYPDAWSINYELHRYLTITPRLTSLSGRVIGTVGQYKVISDI